MHFIHEDYQEFLEGGRVLAENDNTSSSPNPSSASPKDRKHSDNSMQDGVIMFVDEN